MKKTCETCKWWHDEVCVNGDSPCCCDFKVKNDSCEEYEEIEDERV